MKRISIYLLCLLSFIIITIGLNCNYKSDPIINRWTPKNDVVEMPIVLDTKPNKASFGFLAPIEQRGEEFRKYLSSSVKISVNGASGSGTICYYDEKENWAYVISCGHLWTGDKAYSESEKKQKAKVIAWYHNENKLDDPKSYEAEILFWSNKRGYDCSLLRFSPDWTPKYFPIASIDYKIKKGSMLNSLGCDGGGEVARYEVQFIEYRGLDLITEKNSPRPGRSGGGLITDSEWYVGICWGTSDTETGNGTGYFTPLSSIHEVFTKNGHEWLLRFGEFSGRDIPVYDWESPDEKFEWDFVPVPSAGTKSYFFFLKKGQIPEYSHLKQ
jgi:hypothetical protein